MLAVLVLALLTVLGISFLALGQGERHIARNERRSARALYLAEAGARQVRAWFDRPRDGGHPCNPSAAAIDRTLRAIDDDGDPRTPPRPQDGGRWPRYKQGVDRDGDGEDDLFDRPYGDGPRDALLGTPRGPDMRIDERGSAAERALLARLSGTLDGGGAAGPDRARIARIAIYGPPLSATAPPRRRGIATVEVVARVAGLGTERDGVEVAAERTVRVVLDEVPYPRLHGPLRSCAGLSWPGPFTPRWGAVVVAGETHLAADHRGIAATWPRAVPPAPPLDRLWGWDDPLAFVAYRSLLERSGEAVEAPWLRLLAGGRLAGAPAGPQPFPFDPDRAPGPGGWPNHDHPGEDGTHSNLFQSLPGLECAAFDYREWKALATAGGPDARYFAWAGGTSFREDAEGPARTFREITDGAEGVLFFDTADGEPPRDDDADGVGDNLTPPVTIAGGTWGVRGVVLLHARRFEARDVGGRPVVLRAPGEPFGDIDGDGRFDPGEPWVNLRYPRTQPGRFIADATDTLRDDGTFGAAAVRNDRGPEIRARASLWGILYVAGRFGSGGNAVYYGAVVAGAGVDAGSFRAGAPRLLWDQSLARDWPPPGWALPRVRVAAWDAGPGPAAP